MKVVKDFDEEGDLFYADCGYCVSTRYANSEAEVKERIKDHIREKHPEVDFSAPKEPDNE